ncbi:MAG TPA: hypothetical protein PL033_20060 [Candidatus Brocadiia bacterium]|nr:hypothetical protein [Candidatus Brocadiia bacterium]
MFRSAYAIYDTARDNFDKPWLERPSLRDKFAKIMKLAAGEEVHHVIPLGILWKFPGTFKPGELNSHVNFMGLPKTVHDFYNKYWISAIPEIWRVIKSERHLKVDDPGFADAARHYIEKARDFVTPENVGRIDSDYQVFTEELKRRLASEY